ncbi:unnamed protein product [Caenorhabditis auriculariae]|uniref:UBA domain-containing protein n=1 Tax=Caenorhabditis auriculariae TaxID=2777116 RepID=A0A8S1GTI0_9PELO|nr:unnamed protein product [Caenorhabditis auriculariae]
MNKHLRKAIPLVERDHLPPSAHETIVEQMVAGGIAPEENIQRALENNEYSSITATYYLLAERILASCREEQARLLLAKELAPTVDDESAGEGSRSSRPAQVGGNRCRSRSNSWRARPCSILKEESEEELSTYLRSSSRQSSRYFNLSSERQSSSRNLSRCCSSHLSRQNSEELPGTAVSEAEDYQPRPIHFSLFPYGPQSAAVSSSRFEDLLSPIDECRSTEQIRNPEEPSSPNSDRKSWLGHANTSFDGSFDRRSDLSTEAINEVVANQLPALVRRSSSRLVRRNSSPSVSMFGGGSTRDRVSPQAVHDLLELSRFGSMRGRAASPESVRSSRSPSPPASSGRASPALPSLSRLKVSSLSSNVGGSGMRKLSSSPHLLGICEESEENGETSSGTICGAHLNARIDGTARTNRSASTGLVHVPSRHGTVHATKSSGGSLLTSSFSTKSPIPPPLPAVSVMSSPAGSSVSHLSTAPTTYSAVRMIRPRQAVVSPDVCRRYEQHTRFMTRTRRSTSCSSSEASDDEESRRLTMIASKYCGRGNEDGKKDDDNDSNGGVGGQEKRETSRVPVIGGTSTASNTQEGSGTGKEEKRSDMNDCSVTYPLKPIPEMTQLDLTNEKTGRRARLLHRSHTAERILRDWTGVFYAEYSFSSENSNWFGTPPRDCRLDDVKLVKSQNEQWIRHLKRTCSEPELRNIWISCENVDEKEGFHDSGCSSEDRDLLDDRQTNIYDEEDDFLAPGYSLPIEKVNRWLKNAHFCVA